MSPSLSPSSLAIVPVDGDFTSLYNALTGRAKGKTYLNTFAPGRIL